MKRSVTFKGLCINHVGFSCENHCRFCVLGRKRPNNIELDRVISLVDRLREWRDQNRAADYRVFINYFRGMNYTPEALAAMQSLNKRLGEEKMQLMMGGIEHKTDEELRAWLQVWNDAGIEVIRLSLAGTREVHDSWVARPGDFDFNLRAARIAAELGFQRDEWLLVSRTTIPYLKSLTDQLDEIPGRLYRGFRLTTWGNSPKLAAQEQLTRTEFEQLPEWVLKDFQHTAHVKSEREWISDAAKLPDEEAAEAYFLLLYIEDANMDWLESASCDEIVAELERRSLQIYNTVPTFKELGQQYGDTRSELLYWESGIRQEWVRRFVAATGAAFEKRVTWIY
jgi:hypothetical protein